MFVMYRYNKNETDFSQNQIKKIPARDLWGRLREVCDAGNDASYYRNLLCNQYFKQNTKLEKRGREV